MLGLRWGSCVLSWVALSSSAAPNGFSRSHQVSNVMLPITKDASIISPNFESGSVHKWSRKPTDFSTGFCFTEALSTVLIWLHWGPTGNAFFSGYKRIPSRNSTKSAADYSAFPALLLLCSSAVLQIDASPVPELTNRLGWG